MMANAPDQLRSAFGCGSAGAAEVSLELLDGTLDEPELLESGVVDCDGIGWAGVAERSAAGAALLSAAGVALVGGALRSAGIALFGIGSGLVAAGCAASFVVVWADTKPSVPTIVAAAMAAVRVLVTLIVITPWWRAGVRVGPGEVGDQAGGKNRLAQP